MMTRVFRRAAALVSAPVLKTGSAQVATLIPATLATFLTTRLIVEEFGVEAFNGYALGLALISAIPVNNLGMGAAITSAVARRSIADDTVERVVLTSARVVGLSALGVSIFALVLALVGGWETVMGSGSDAGPFFGIAAIVYAMSFLPGLSNGILQGSHREHVTTYVTGLLRPAVLLFAVVVFFFELDPRWLAVIPALGYVVVNVVNAGMAARLTGFSWRRIARRVANRRRYPGDRVRDVAVPRVVTMIAVALTVATDRIVLSHFAAPIELTRFTIGMQIFAPVMTVVIAAGKPLWPLYLEADEQGTSAPRVGAMLAIFGGVAALGSGVLVLVADPLGALVGGEQVALGLELPLWLAAMTVSTAVAIPVGNTLTTPGELRYLALLTALGIPVNLGISIPLAAAMGAPGPAIGTAVVMVFLGTLPILVYLRRRSQRGAAGPPAAREARTV